MAHLKNRSPFYFRGIKGLNWEQFSKADWADLYADLYLQTHGEEASGHEFHAIIEDAEKRLETLKANGCR